MEDGNVRNPEYLTGNVENTLLATFLTGTMCANENYKCENTHLATFSTGMLCANVNQSVTFVWILTRTNIRIFSFQENDTNEHPNIFV